jgi:hypothetical protein
MKVFGEPKYVVRMILKGTGAQNMTTQQYQKDAIYGTKCKLN